MRLFTFATLMLVLAFAVNVEARSLNSTYVPVSLTSQIERELFTVTCEPQVTVGMQVNTSHLEQADGFNLIPNVTQSLRDRNPIISDILEKINELNTKLNIDLHTEAEFNSLFK